MSVRIKDLEGKLREISLPSDVKPNKFKFFWEAIRQILLEKREVMINEAAEQGHVCEETASQYLELLRRYKFLNIKEPQWRAGKVYPVGCTPVEEFEYGQESRESTAGKIGFDFLKRAAGFVRPAYIAGSPLLSGEDKAKEFWKWYNGDGYWCEVDLLVGTTPLWTVLGIICANELRKLPSGASGPRTF
jgi:hypothetical protein